MNDTIDLGVEGLSPAVYVGAGGSANVFAARVLATGEEVAVKLLRASADSVKERQRFEREHETISLLSTHDGIVPLVDAGVTDRNEPYFLMPLMEGSLQDRIDNEGAIDWETASQLVADVADTLEFAHSKKILHRDLKPGNILLDTGGIPRVADFGIAKLMDSSVSKSSKALGTPSFMPPERFRAIDATEASDVYGLGATLAALLTGTAPFLTGENDTDAAVMMRVMNDEPPPLADSGVPEPIANIVTRSMAKEPVDRPASAREFAELLRTATIASGGAPSTGPVTVAIPRRDLEIPELATLTPEKEESDRRPAWLLAAAAALFALVLGIGGLFALSQRDGSSEAETAGSLDVTEVGDEADGSTAADEDASRGDDGNAEQADASGALTDGGDDSSTTDKGAEGNTAEGTTSDGNATGSASTGSAAGVDTEVAGRTETNNGSTAGTTPPATEDKNTGGVVETDDNKDEGKTETTDPPVVVATPVACFTASDSSVFVGGPVHFTNCSTDAGSYQWSYGDGTSSSSTNPTKSWTTTGSKTVRLTATGAGGSHSATRTITVNAVPVAAPKASFTASATTIDPGDSVTFTSASTGDITTFEWDFGDGSAATGATAWHTYNTHGTYSAKLTVTGPGGSHSATRTITVRQPTVTPVFTKVIEMGDFGDDFVRFRFTSNVTTGYTVRIRNGSTVAKSQSGTAQANSMVSLNVGGLTPGTDYTLQVTLNGPPSVDSSRVGFRTSGGVAPPPTTTQVTLNNLRSSDIRSNRFQVNYESNICANGSFVIREQGGPVVGSNAGQSNGCTTTHLGIPGFWTSALKPNTTYVITLTVEADGQGNGNGNTATKSLTVTTSG